MKKDIGFRFSEETHSQLLELSGLWNCTRTQVIERLVAAESPAWREQTANAVAAVGRDIAESLPEKPAQELRDAKELLGKIDMKEEPGNPAVTHFTYESDLVARVKPAKVEPGDLPPVMPFEKKATKPGRTITGRPHGPVPKGGKK